MRRARAIALGVVAALSLAGCHRDETTGSDDSAKPVAAAKPIDHLAPDELVAGADHAFSLVLPTAAKVAGRFVDVVYADMEAPAEATAKYVAANVRDGTEKSGIEGTTFSGVRIPGDVGKVFRVEITPRGIARCRLEIRDVTPPPVPNLPDEEARWRAVGMKPNGELVDPKKIH